MSWTFAPRPDGLTNMNRPARRPNNGLATDGTRAEKKETVLQEWVAFAILPNFDLELRSRGAPRRWHLKTIRASSRSALAIRTSNGFSADSRTHSV